MMRLHERFGLSLVQVAPDERATTVRTTESRLDRVDLMPWDHQALPEFACAAAVAYYLVEDHEATRNYARRVVPAAQDYYYGNWRTKVKTDLGTFDPSWWHDKEPWMNVFRAALCWGSVLGDWQGLRKLAEYPDEHRSMEKSGIDAKPAMRQLLLDIAKCLQGEEVTKVADRVGKLAGAGWRGTRVLAEALDAIAAKDDAAANEAINGFLRLHHKRKKSKDITDSVSLDATLMVNLARRDGLRITVDPKLEMYVIKL